MPEITQDHDLLIRVDENVRNMNGRLDTMQRDNAAQLTELRNTKVDVKDFEEHKREVDKRFLEAAHYGSESLSEYKTTMGKTIDDFKDVMKKQGDKLDGLVVKMAVAVGAIGVITFIAPYVWDALLR